MDNFNEIRIGINGFGRIGRLVCRHVLELRKDGVLIKVVAINATKSPDYLAYQFCHDTVHGRYPGKVLVESVDMDGLIIDGMKIRVSQCRNPVDIPWVEMGADYICESTGFFTNREGAYRHLETGAKKVVISAPPTGDIPMYVMGVNHMEYQGEEIVSNASCTTNCLAPLAEILNRHFGIEMGLITTVHSMTASQQTVDGSSRDGKDWRVGRSANNIIPTSTGAAKAVGKIIPSLAGRLTGMAFRVPTLNVSVVDLTCVLGFDEGLRDIRLDRVLEVIREESRGDRYRGIVGVEEEPVVSSDFTGDNRSCIVDAKACLEIGNGIRMLKIVAWYDNEWAYSRRLVELIRVISNEK